jgi:hypothetical protein
VYVLRQDPKEFVLTEEGDRTLRQAMKSLVGTLYPQSLQVDRGPYRILAALDEGGEPLVAEGCLIDLYDPALPVYTHREVLPGTQALLYDLSKAGRAPKILAAASRAYEEKKSRNRFSYVCKGPAETWNVTRILLPAPPVKVLVNGTECPASWDETSRTVFLRFPNSPDGVPVEIDW